MSKWQRMKEDCLAILVMVLLLAAGIALWALFVYVHALIWYSALPH